MADFEIIRMTTAEWEFQNPTLLANQLGVCTDLRDNVETDTGYQKLGNGVDAWNDLPYVNTGGGGATYAVYRALLSQSGTDAPVATVLENSLGGTLVWTREDVGVYLGTLADAFTADKTWFSLMWGGSTEEGGKARLQRDTANVVSLETGDGTALIDNWGPMSIEILVYP